MAGEYGVDLWRGTVLIPITVREKVQKRYGKPGEPATIAIRRLCEEATKGVRLTKGELESCVAEEQSNYRKRMQRRAEKARNKVNEKGTKR